MDVQDEEPARFSVNGRKYMLRNIMNLQDAHLTLIFFTTFKNSLEYNRYVGCSMHYIIHIYLVFSNLTSRLSTFCERSSNCAVKPDISSGPTYEMYSVVF